MIKKPRPKPKPKRTKKQPWPKNEDQIEAQIGEAGSRPPPKAVAR